MIGRMKIIPEPAWESLYNTLLLTGNPLLESSAYTIRYNIDDSNKAFRREVVG
jgi:hypothetical protein